MQPSGAGILNLMDNHKEKKEIHHQLYSEFDIDTIAESGRGIEELRSYPEKTKTSRT